MRSNLQKITEPKEAALIYAELGLAVIPITTKNGIKKPLLTDWPNKATTDPEKIRSWWKKWPFAGVGFVTGEKSGGVVVIDFDQHPEDGRRGLELLESWQQENGEFPETWTARTGSGGIHLFFRAPKSLKTHKQLHNRQVDFLAEGSYAVLPPSVHPNGKRYEWIKAPDQQPIAEYKDNAAAFIDVGYLDKLDTGSTFEAQPEILAGGRTEYLFKMLCSLQAKGYSDETIKAAIEAENEASCKPPLTEAELEHEVYPALKRYEKGPAATGSGLPARRSAPLAVDLLSLSSVKEGDPEWLIPGYIPRYQITSLAGDGGSGKTTVWCAIAAAISSGRPCFMEAGEDPAALQRKPGTVMFFSAEDSLKYTLVRRLRKNGADLSRIISLDIADERFRAVKFNGPYLERLLAKYRPKLCIFDPIQSFVPPQIKMGDRNAMRQCLEPLIGYGDNYGTTFLIIEHSNKQAGSYGRKRIADSADIWDISRSVLMVGDAGNGQRYLSQEKVNYGEQQETVLFTLEDEKPAFRGKSSMRDRDFVLTNQYNNKAQPQRESAKELILWHLESVEDPQTGETGRLETGDLDAMLKNAGVSKSTAARAKAELVKEGRIRTEAQGFGKGKKWVTALCKDSNE